VRQQLLSFDSGNYDISDTTHYVATTQQVAQTAAPTKMDGWISMIRQGLLVIFLAWLLWRFTKIGFKFLYIFANNHRMRYYKILLPRNDSKSDRDEQKDLAKDMKEKIGRMTQVYMNLSRLGKLNSWDKFMNFMFNKPRVSFIYHYENGQLFFVA
jgi:hypothetical protein